jgi:putative ABC transport system permease protein
MWTLFRIAARNVLRNRRRTLITLAALLVGVGVMVSIRGLLSGFQRGLVLGVVQGQTGAIQVHKKGYLANVLSNPINLDFPADEVLAKVRAEPGVSAASARIQFAGLLSSGEETLFFGVVGVDPRGEFEVCSLRRQTLGAGSALGEEGLVVTTQLGRVLKLATGGEAALLASDRDGALNGENVRLTGTMNLNVPGEQKVGLVSLATAQRLLRMEGRATEVVVGVPEDQVDDLRPLVERLRARLGPEYEVNSWEDVAVFIRQTQARQNFILQVIAGVFMVLMLLGVANTMLMSVLERTREVGTMMAVGVRRSQIMVLFLFEALGLGALGGVVGAAAGRGLVAVMGARGLEVTAPGQNVPFLIRPYVLPGYLLFVVGVAALGSVLFALYPAWRASRLRPVEALSGG